MVDSTVWHCIRAVGAIASHFSYSRWQINEVQTENQNSKAIIFTIAITGVGWK
jgi:hypothetical protein